MRHTLQNVITYHFLWRPSVKVSLLIFEIGALFLRSKSTNTFVKKYVTMKKAYLRTVLKWKRWIPVPTCCTPKRTNSIPDSSSGSKLPFQEQTSFLSKGMVHISLLLAAILPWYVFWIECYCTSSSRKKGANLRVQECLFTVWSHSNVAVNVFKLPRSSV